MVQVLIEEAWANSLRGRQIPAEKAVLSGERSNLSWHMARLNMV